MRRFGFLILALAAMSVFLAPGQREDTGTAIAPSADKAPVGAAPERAGEPIKTAHEETRQSAGVAPPASDPAPLLVKIAAEPVAAMTGAEKPGQPEATAAVAETLSEKEMITAVQRELVRLACYEGKIDGKWGRKSRAAIDDFIEHTGADIDGEPSRGMLTALQGAPANACDTTATAVRTTQQSATASIPAEDQKPSLTERDLAYLPPWMRDEKRANPNQGVEQPEEGKPAKAEEPAKKRTKSARRRVERKWKDAANRPRRSWERRSTFLGEGWPRSTR